MMHFHKPYVDPDRHARTAALQVPQASSAEGGDGALLIRSLRVCISSMALVIVEVYVYGLCMSL